MLGSIKLPHGVVLKNEVLNWTNLFLWCRRKLLKDFKFDLRESLLYNFFYCPLKTTKSNKIRSFLYF